MFYFSYVSKNPLFSIKFYSYVLNESDVYFIKLYISEFAHLQKLSLKYNLNSIIEQSLYMSI